MKKEKRNYRSLTHQEVKDLFDYDLLEGILYHKKDSKHHRAGDAAGYSGFFKSGSKFYVLISIPGISAPIPGHRLAWFWVHGVWPRCIDHLDRDGLNNRLCNMRDVSRSENQRNAKLNANNKSGQCGVYRTKSGKYGSRIVVAGKSKHLGVYDFFADAAKVRKLAEVEFGFNENHGNVLPIPAMVQGLANQLTSNCNISITLI